MGYFAFLKEMVDGSAETALSKTDGNNSPAIPNKGSSLADAIKLALAMKPKWSVLAYADSDDLMSALTDVYGRLTTLLGTRADLWALNPNRTPGEVKALVDRAVRTWPNAEMPYAVLRPGMKRLKGVGKPRAAIASEATRVAHNRGTGFAAVIAEVLVPALSDHDLLSALANLPGSIDETDCDWTLATVSTATAGTWFPTTDTTSVSGFCLMLFDTWGGVADRDLAERLDRVQRRLRPKTTPAPVTSAVEGGSA